MTPRDLFGQRSFLALVAAETLSTTGAMMSWLALPWFVLVTTGSATRMGVVLGAELAGVALLGVPGGVLAARLGARRTMLAADGLRAPLMVSIPLLHWAGLLSFARLVALVFVLGAASAPHFAAQRVILPEILGEDDAVVTQANAVLQAATRITLLLGPVLAGVLIGFVGAPAVLLVDAATYAVSFVLVLAFVPPGERVAAAPEERGLLVGLRFVARDRILRGWTLAIAVGDAGWNALFAALPFYAFTRYDGDARLAGLLLACFGVAAVAGNVVSLRIASRVDRRHLIALGVIGQALPLWILTANGPAWTIGAALLLSGLANGVANPSIHAILTMRPPPAIRAQALTAEMTVIAVAGPVGYLVAGPVLEEFGVLPVFIAVAAVQAVAMGSRALAVLREPPGAAVTAGSAAPRDSRASG
ncbi:MAG: MFS transporter [Gaiellaceae bacterium]